MAFTGWLRAGVLLIAGGAAATARGDGAEKACRDVPSAAEIGKLAATPDYKQDDGAYGGLGTNGNVCGPAAVSNTLMWLADHGFPRLAPRTGDRKKDQHDLIVKLSAPAYFNTVGEKLGTPPATMLTGLARYLADAGYTARRLEWNGWTPLPIPPEHDSGVRIPDVPRMKVAVERAGAAWLLLGYGVADAATGTYRITGGHWVTLVGHGWDGAKKDPRFLVIHDPLTSPEHVYVKVAPLEPGTFAVDVWGVPKLTWSAAGFLRLEGKFAFEGKDVWLLGAVILEMPGGCR